MFTNAFSVSNLYRFIRLLNKHFELRGAMFIPGWIEDLSLPEHIINFAPLSLPVIGRLYQALANFVRSFDDTFV